MTIHLIYDDDLSVTECHLVQTGIVPGHWPLIRDLITITGLYYCQNYSIRDGWRVTSLGPNSGTVFITVLSSKPN